MHTFTNATVHIYEGDIAITDGVASRDEVTIYRATLNHEFVIYPEMLIHRAALMPQALPGIHWNADLHMPYSYTLRDACKLADVLANRYGLTFGVYNYEGDDATHYIVDTAFNVDDLENITCYYTAPNAMEGRIVRLPDGGLGWVHILAGANDNRGYHIYHASLMYQNRVPALNFHLANEITPLSRPPLPWDEDQIAFIATSEKESVQGQAKLYDLLNITFKITRKGDSWLLFP